MHKQDALPTEELIQTEVEELESKIALDGGETALPL